MRSVLKSFVGLCAALSLAACSPMKISKGEEISSTVFSVRASQTKKTACISFQGNGVYFSSHVGALIALLENNVEPVFATGGSSGAILASVARALVENPSLSAAGEFNPQDAARVLAASAPIVESVLFLPRLTTPLLLLDSLDVFLTGSSLGVLRADPSDGLVNAESIVGQATLVVDYYRTTDFSGVLSKTSVLAREKEIARLWKGFANSIEVTPEQVAEALLVDRETLVAEGRTELVEIQDRLFKLYRSKNDTFLNDYRAQQESWNNFIRGNKGLFGLESQQRRQTVFKKLIETVKSVESFDALAATLSGDFMLADPDRVYRAFEGFDSRTNRRIQIPSNTVLHSTARRAVRKNGSWREVQGLASLHQVYFTNPELAAVASERLLTPENNPLQPRDRNLQPVIPSDRIVVTAQALGPALATTTGEPTAFLRFPIDLDSSARTRLGWTTVDETLMGYGGWLEKVSLGTARQFDACAPQKVDTYFYTSDGDGVNRFAKMAFLGLFIDQPVRGLLAKQIENPTNIRALLAGTSDNNAFSAGIATDDFNAAVGSADSVFASNRDIKARAGHVPVNFNYVKPSEQQGAQADLPNIAIRSNRRAMILAAYEFTRRMLAEQKLNVATIDLWNVPGGKVQILSSAKPEEIQAVVNSAFPRDSY